MKLELPDDIAQLLMGWLEDEAEQHFILPTDEEGEYDMDEAERQVFSGETAANLEVLAQHDPPYAYILARLYDWSGWPKKFDMDGTQQVNQMIATRIAEIQGEQRQLHEGDEP